MNSTGTAASLEVRGVPGETNDTLSVEINGAPALSVAILASGDLQLPANPTNPCFSLGSGVAAGSLDGLRCIGGNLMRHGVRLVDTNGDVGLTNAGWGGDSDALGTLTAQGSFVAGQPRHFQVYYTESTAVNCGNGWNTTQGTCVTFIP